MSVREKSPSITVSIPKADPDLQIYVYCHQGLKCTPAILEFQHSNTANFSLKGKTLGRKSITFIKFGKSSQKYASTSLPQGKIIILEPPFMKHVFQLKSKKRDPETKRKVSYMFSVANEEQRQNWAGQVENILGALESGYDLEYGFPLNDDEGLQILDDFSTPSQGAVVVPTNADLKFKK